MKLPRLRRLALVACMVAVPVATSASTASATTFPTYKSMSPVRNMNVVRTLDRKSLVVSADPVNTAVKYVVTHNGTKVYEGRKPIYTDTNRALGVGVHVYSMIAINATGQRTAPNVASFEVEPFASVLPPIYDTPIGSAHVILSQQIIRVYGTQAIFPKLIAIIQMSSGLDGSTPTGSFKVFSKSENAQFSSTEFMSHMIRFTKGRNGGNIGFHSIPFNLVNGAKRYLETPLGIAPSSHGCIRTNDYAAAWLFRNMDIGARVLVVN